MVTYRPYAPGDEAQILELYRAAFGIELSLDEWRWHYGHDQIIELAEVDGRVIGHYAVQLRPFFVEARACTAGLVIGSMVAPEFRNITTFVELARRAYAACRERAVAFVYAFPNDNVWLVRKRMLSWHELPAIAALAVSVRDTPRDRASSVVQLAPDEPLDAPWLDRANDRICASDRASFLHWRLRERPHVDYPIYVDRDAGEVRGYIALKRYNAAVGHVVAFRVAPGDPAAGRRLLASALAHFAEAGVERITTWLLPSSPLYTVAVDAGFAADAGTKQNFGYLAFDDGLAAVLADPARWDVAMADSDVF